MLLPTFRTVSSSIGALNMNLRRFFLAVLCLMLCPHAQAEIYRCTSNDGKPINSDRVPAECKGKVIKVFSNSGTLKKEILPPMNAGEKQKHLEAIESEQQQKRAIEELQREERFLTAHFRSESDIIQAHKKALTEIEAKKKMVKEQLELLAGLVNGLIKEINEAKQSDKNSKNYQQLYQSRIDDLSRSIKKSQDQLTIYDSEIERINREYNQTLERYRVVVASRAKG